MRGGNRVRKALVDELMNMSEAERAIFFEELKAEKQKREAAASAPWPRYVKMYLHQPKESGWHLGESIGLDMDSIGSWCPGYEVELVIEVSENGDSYIVACDGFMLDYDSPFTGGVYNAEE